MYFIYGKTRSERVLLGTSTSTTDGSVGSVGTVGSSTSIRLLVN